MSRFDRIIEHKFWDYLVWGLALYTTVCLLWVIAHNPEHCAKVAKAALATLGSNG